MQVSALVKAVDGVTLVAGGEVEVASLADDSRQVKPGALFVARAGAHGDGRAFIQDAIAKGAVAVLADAGVAPIDGVAWLAARSGGSQQGSKDAAALLPWIAEAFHGFPSRRLRLVGITGTNGKTTTTYLYRHIARIAGRRCGLIGTVETDDGAGTLASNLTTPGAIDLSATFARMVANGCDGAVMETSSHALHQGRVAALRFGCGIFTNLTGDHLDYHGSMEAYASAKAILFAGLDPCATAVVNADDPAHERMLRDCRANVIRCSVRSPRATASAQELRVGVGSMRLRLVGPWGRIEADLPFTGRHNTMNTLQAVAAAWSGGIDGSVIEQALTTCAAPPGRLEPVTAPGDPFAVVVDYAHTDDALLNVCTALKSVLEPGGRLITVFGCGGDRDPTKRPRMARVACDHSDVVVVTSDNPRTEAPESIVDQIMAGVPQGTAAVVHRVTDRSAAIHAAVAEARERDVVLIAGKGHEDYQIIGTVKHPFDDRTVARSALVARTAIQEGALA
jgi:UDP-N-acetylmuramoyl-L-alanyl-D-glutamate--2,6-diaminopimelate ligase